MKTNFTLFLAGLLAPAFYNISAQSSPTELDLLLNDMLLIAENFVTPGAESSAVESTAAWFTTAQVIEKWQVEVSLKGNVLFVPGKKQSKLSSDSDFHILTMRETTSAVLPTVYGGDSDVVFEGEVFGQEISFSALEGLDKDALVHPFLQVNAGLPFRTEIALRYLPHTVIRDVGFSTYGVGFKHALSPYFSLLSQSKVELAAVISFSNFQLDYSFAPRDIQVAVLDQIGVDANIWLFQAQLSKRFGNFEISAGPGVTNSNFSYELGGTGNTRALNSALKRIGGTETKLKVDLGLNYYFGKFKLSGVFTAGTYFNAAAGISYKVL